MSGWFDSFALTPTGIALADAIETPENLAACRVLSEQGKPAVQAVAKDVTPIIEALASKREKDAASQFVGWFVGQLMRQAGYKVIQERGRVSNAPYKTGAVWTLDAVEPKLVSDSPSTAGLGRLSLIVGQDGNALFGHWEIATSEVSRLTGRPRRVHTVMSNRQDLDAAVQDALAYARRHGFAAVWVKDPCKLFPKENWPTT